LHTDRKNSFYAKNMLTLSLIRIPKEENFLYSDYREIRTVENRISYHHKMLTVCFLKKIDSDFEFVRICIERFE